MAILTTTQEDIPIISSMQNNLVAHMLFLPERMPSCTVLKAQELIIINANIPDANYNIIVNAQLQEDNAYEVAQTTIEYFQREHMPAVWWIGPYDAPESLSHILQTNGLLQNRILIGMQLNIEYYGYQQVELRIERVLEHHHIEDYISVMTDAHDYDEHIQDWYYRLFNVPLSLQDYEQLYIGYLDDTPVACGSVTLHANVAGVYNVATKKIHRKRGFATAMIQELLTRSQEAGYTTAVLIAPKNATSIYERIGFEHLCEYLVFESTATY